MNTAFRLFAAAIATTGATNLLAQGHMHHSSGHDEAAPAFNGALVEGEVRKVDKAAGKLTIRHAPLPDMNMPAMIMVFRAGDAAMLEKLKAGDAIRFRATRDGAAMTVTEYQPIR